MSLSFFFGSQSHAVALACIPTTSSCPITAKASAMRCISERKLGSGLYFSNKSLTVFFGNLKTATALVDIFFGSHFSAEESGVRS